MKKPDLDRLEQLIDDPHCHGMTMPGVIARAEEDLQIPQKIYQALLSKAFAKEVDAVRETLRRIIQFKRAAMQS